MKKRAMTRKTGSPGKGKNQKQTGQRQDKGSDELRREPIGKWRRDPALPEPKPDKHGGSGAGRQQGGSGPGREHG